MESNMICYILAFVISILCVLVGGSSASLGIDGDTEDQVWVNCKLDLMHIKDFNKNPDIDEILDLKASSLRKSSVELIAVLPPQMKHTLWDCLNRRQVPSGISEEEKPTKWYIEYLDSLLGWKTVSRQLVDQSLQNITPTLASLAEAPAPFSVQAPASPPALAPNGQPPVIAPTQPSSQSDPFDLTMAPIGRDSNSGSPEVAPIRPSEKHTSSQRAVAIAVVITAAFTFLFSGLLFYCYHKCCKNNNRFGDGQRDERPLLTLSMSSSPISMVRMDSAQPEMNKGKLGSLSFQSNRIQNGWGPDMQSSPTPWQSNEAISIEISPISSETAKSNSSLSLTEIPSSGAFSSVSKSSSEPSETSIDKLAPSIPPPPVMPSDGKANPPPPPPLPTRSKPGPQPPPPPPPVKGTFPPRPPTAGPVLPKPSPLGFNNRGNASSGSSSGANVEAEAPKAKLKPFFWDKVLANPDQSMVWHKISTGSFQFNEDMIESLFGYSSTNTRKNELKKEAPEDPQEYHHILDAKKAQNISILLRALNVTTEEVCDAITEGNELPIELLQTMLKMAPTVDEELKLRLFAGPLSQLRPAERFLKALVEIPFAFKRMEILLFMGSLQEEVSNVKVSFVTLEVACKELRSSKLFFKLLEAVLKTGNRMNDGTFRGGAHAFKLDTLLKLADVKGADGKTTLLHFVVQEIIRSEGVRAARVARECGSISSFNLDDFLEDPSCETSDHFRSLGLQVVSSLSTELENVKKAAALDADGLTGTVSGLGHGLVKVKDFLNSEMKSLEEVSGFHSILSCFVDNAEDEITWLLGEDKRIRSLVKGTTDYFHGNAGKDEGFRLFVIVRDFLGMLDKTCKEVKETPKKLQTPKRDAATPPLPSHRNLLFPAIRDRCVDSDEDNESP